MASILAVDDEVGILDMIQSILSKDGHSVTGITNPVEINYTKVSSFDLILLDIMMPGIDGFTLCKKLRNQVDCPIVFLTAKSEENSLVNGLSLGADDYICKPFGVMELRARISAHLRREQREHSVRISFEHSSFNISAKQFSVKDVVVPLTNGEYEICEFLARNQGQVLPKNKFLKMSLGMTVKATTAPSSRTLKTFATNCRNLNMHRSRLYGG